MNPVFICLGPDIGRTIRGHSHAKLPPGWTHKACPGCGFIATRAEYGTQARCRACRRAYTQVPGYQDKRRAYYQRTKEVRNVYQRDWKQRNKDRLPHYGRKFRHGILAADYEALVAAQDGRCAICQTVPDRDLFVDHDHATGAIRGLLCDLCNRGLGMLQDDPKLLRRAAGYVEARRG